VGTPQVYPDWAAPVECFTGQPTNGTVGYVGQDPYKEPTVWSVDLEYIGREEEFHLPDEVIDLRVWSNREALKAYVANKAYGEWLLHGFLPRIGDEAHVKAVCTSIDENIPWQFSISDPAKVVTDEGVRQHLASGNPDNIRHALALSLLRYDAKDHPKIILAHALLQGSFGPYLDNMEQALIDAPIDATAKNVGRQVIAGPFNQLRNFTVYVGPVLLAILRRKDIMQQDFSLSGEAADRQAISWAWEIMHAKNLLRRRLSSGHYMMCPGTRLINYIRKRGVPTGLYNLVDTYQHTPLFKAFLERASATAERVMNNQDFYYNYFRGKEAFERRHVRNGKGPFFEEAG